MNRGAGSDPNPCFEMADAGAVGGGHALPPVRHHRAEERWMRLAALHRLSHRDLLGDQGAAVGPQGESGNKNPHT